MLAQRIFCTFVLSFSFTSLLCMKPGNNPFANAERTSRLRSESPSLNSCNDGTAGPSRKKRHSSSKKNNHSHSHNISSAHENYFDAGAGESCPFTPASANVSNNSNQNPSCSNTQSNGNSSPRPTVVENLKEAESSPFTTGFGPEEIRDMENAFASAPSDVKNIVRHLNNPDFFSYGKYRTALFVGKPGRGKTTLAKAIAYKMSNTPYQEQCSDDTSHNGKLWEYKIIAATAFKKHARDGSTEAMNSLFDEILANTKPFILVIDELDVLLSNANSTNHDTDSSSRTLWTFIDKQQAKPNHKFFFIGTMNDTELHKAPEAFKSRILARSILFDTNQCDIDTAVSQFYNLFESNNSAANIPIKAEDVDGRLKSDASFDKKSNNMKLHAEIDHACLKENFILAKLNAGNPREQEEFAFFLKKICRRYDIDSSVTTILKHHLEEASNEYGKIVDLSQYGTIAKSDEDRRHDADAALREKHHIQNILIQIITQQYQATHSRSFSFLPYGIGPGYSQSWHALPEEAQKKIDIIVKADLKEVRRMMSEPCTPKSWWNNIGVWTGFHDESLLDDKNMVYTKADKKYKNAVKKAGKKKVAEKYKATPQALKQEVEQDEEESWCEEYNTHEAILLGMGSLGVNTAPFITITAPVARPTAILAATIRAARSWLF